MMLTAKSVIKSLLQQRLVLMGLMTSLASSAAFAVNNSHAMPRKDPITAIVIHAIGGPVCKGNRVIFTKAPGNAQRWKEWFERQKSVSIHYVVDREGLIAQSIAENRVAWHANDYNRGSIGIELVNNGDSVEPYPDKQVTALSNLIRQILVRHKTIHLNNIVRHSDIDNRTFNCDGKKVKQKQDPGPIFPYDSFISNLK